MVPTTTNTRLLNFLERVGWTLLQVISAEAIVAGINEIWDTSLSIAWVAIIATGLAALKGAAAQAFGSPTGASLPINLQPVLAEEVAVRAVGDVLTAGEAIGIRTGTEVVADVVPA